MRSSIRPGYIAALVLAILLFATTNVWATGSHHTPPPQPKPAAAASAASSAHAAAGALSVSKGGNASSQATGGKASSVASQEQRQTASSDQDQSQTANNEGVQQGVEFNQEYRQVRQVQTAIAGNGLGSTADCLKAGGAGAQAPTFGLSIGGSRKDHDCSRYILANNLYARGQKQAGDKVFCQITEVKQALGADCLALINEVAAVKAEYPPGERERRQERVGFDKVNK